jgi:iron complex transport system ATP-binding protein
LIALGTPEQDFEDIVRALGLQEFLERRLDRLSTGERSRVLIARALAARPKLLLLDEPIANLDPYWQLKLMDWLRSAPRERGQGVLLALHDLDLAARYADRLILMDRRRIVADGEPAAIVGGPQIAAVFGIARENGLWRPLSPAEDRRSSP